MWLNTLFNERINMSFRRTSRVGSCRENFAPGSPSILNDTSYLEYSNLPVFYSAEFLDLTDFYISLVYRRGHVSEVSPVCV